MQSIFTKAIDLISNFNIKFRTSAMKQEITDEGFQILISSDDFIDLVAREGKRFLKESKKFLSTFKESISITTSAFGKSLFTTSINPRYFIWENFQKRMLNKASDLIPEFKGVLKSMRLTKSIKDYEILAEIGESNIFSIDEACAIFKALTERQPNGEAGDLLNDRYANIIYVRLDEETVVPSFVCWDSSDCKWRLAAFSFDDRSWDAGPCVLVRG
ncbi:MAG: hypothetical protein LiPW41_444 [Parcubacteria group bacterium LiPW_41]|nr:MAG: hypothetical protein LiPW41_444 [Parcubacteria group bacterium LiPW_41]